MNTYLVTQLVIMALVTYLIRALPFTLFRKKITNRFVRSFLYYVPFAVLSAMTFPDIFTSTSSVYSAAVGCIVAVIFAYCDFSLLAVSVLGCVAVGIAEWTFLFL